MTRDLVEAFSNGYERGYQACAITQADQAKSIATLQDMVVQQVMEAKEYEATIAQLQLDNAVLKAEIEGCNLNYKYVCMGTLELQLDNDRLREALEKINITACLSSAEPSIEELKSILEAIDIRSDEALATTQPESQPESVQKPLTISQINGLFDDSPLEITGLIY